MGGGDEMWRLGSKDVGKDVGENIGKDVGKDVANGKRFGMMSWRFYKR